VCDTLLSATALAGADAPVAATSMWGRDGAGPLPPLLVVGGSSS